jgi:hypothetical protein
VLSETFSDGSAAPNWIYESSHPAISAIEQNGQLQIATTPSGAGASEYLTAGYRSNGWRLRTTSDVKMKLTFRAYPAGASSTTNSEVGAGISIWTAGAETTSIGLRPGITIAVGQINDDFWGTKRFVSLAEVTESGVFNPIYRFLSFSGNDHYFFLDGDGSFQASLEVGYDPELLFLRYSTANDTLYLGESYTDPEALPLTNATLGERLPIELGLGGFARFPGLVAAGTTAPLWIDNVIIDSGVIERPPSNVQASDGSFDSKVRVTWGAAAGAQGYRVFRQAPGGSEQVLAPSLASSVLAYDDAGATPGIEYTYRIQAIVPTGDGYSASNSGWRTVAVPTGVNATDGSLADQVTVTWTAVTGATGYEVFRALGSAAAVKIADVASDATSYSDVPASSGAAPIAGTIYKYSVKAKAGSLGVSAASTVNTGWRGLGVPGSVTATDGTLTTGVTISWSAVPGATGYKVFRAVGSGAATQVGTTNASTLTYLNTNAVAGTLYTYTVKAVAAAGDSPASASDTGWRIHTAPTNVQATDGTLTTGVNVTWGAVSGATNYQILRKINDSEDDAVPIGTDSASPYLDSTAVAGVTYAYSVRVKASDGGPGPGLTSTPNTGYRASGFADGGSDGGSDDGSGDDGAPASLIASNPDGPGDEPVDDTSAAPGSGVGTHPLAELLRELPFGDREQVIVDLLAAIEAPDCVTLQARLEGLAAGAWSSYSPEQIAALGAQQPSGKSVACQMLAGDIDLDGAITALDGERFCDAWCRFDLMEADLDRNGRLDVADIVLAAVSQATSQPGATD